VLKLGWAGTGIVKELASFQATALRAADRLTREDVTQPS
jgi:hypothetical protein